jgi:hypothetical protein
MRIALLIVVFCLSTLFSSAAQAPASATPQPLQLLQSALAALSPNVTTHDVTLSGAVQYTVGSDEEAGTATLEAIATGASRLDLSLPSGQRIEVRNLTVSPPTGYWSGPDGVSHAVAYHNLVNEPAWFFPAAAIIRLLAGPQSVATYVGVEAIDSQSVQHVSVIQQPTAVSATTESLPHLTQIDFYLDSSTFLPAAMRFNIHPDDNELADIPIEVRFSNYTAVSGTQVPFHIQRYLNNGLVLDFQANSAVLNSGLTPTGFAAPAGR